MARAHFVKSARKNYPEHGIKKGDSYYWWKFVVGGRGGPKHYSKTAPRRSQLTQSDFLAAIYDIEDDLGALSADTIEDLESQRDDLVGRIRELGEEQQSKLDNMPDGLQQGGTGELLQTRIDECESWANELGGVDISFDNEDAEDDEDADEALRERLDEIISELQDCAYNGE